MLSIKIIKSIVCDPNFKRREGTKKCPWHPRGHFGQSFDVNISDLLFYARRQFHTHPQHTTNSVDLVFPERTPTIKLLRRFVNVNKIAHRNNSFGNVPSPHRSSSACEVMCFNSISNFLVSIFIVFLHQSPFPLFFSIGHNSGCHWNFLDWFFLLQFVRYRRGCHW